MKGRGGGYHRHLGSVQPNYVLGGGVRIGATRKPPRRPKVEAIDADAVNCAFELLLSVPL
jgi:hypothetical protein